MGKRLDAARGEIEKAKEALESMKNANDPKTFDSEWKDLLGRLTRMWNKTQAVLKGDPRFTNSPSAKMIQKARKSDPLIRYLAQARDTEEHSADPITGELAAGLEGRFEFPDGNWATIRSPEIVLPDGTKIPLGFAGHSHVRFAPAEVFAKPVTNRGVTYDVPTSHAGGPLLSHDLVHFGFLAIRFYESALDGLVAEGWDA